MRRVKGVGFGSLRAENLENFKNGQRQRRNTGVSPLRRQSAPPSVEMTKIRVSDGLGRDDVHRGLDEWFVEMMDF